MITKKVINKFLKYLAVSLFVFAMVANIQITLTDPFMFTSEMVLAQATADDTSTDEGICCAELDSSCTHPDGLTFADSIWVAGESDCNGNECTDCTW
jgi:hypothetical protein